MSDPSALAEILNETGLEGPSLITQAGSSEIKELLRERTTAATSAGVFGVPTMLVGKSLFWGLDDFTYLEAFLNNEDPLHEEDIKAWSKVRPSAWRRNVS